MTIKALLLGSAAAMAVVSGAQAADAVVIPEPEAVEYVRVCDAAGAGYFYIPGGETCLKIGGYVQFEVKTANGANDLDYSTESVLNINTYTDSDFGAVKTYIKIQGGGNPGNLAGGLYDNLQPTYLYTDSDYGIRMDRATLSIGGLTMGWTNSFMDFADGAGAADDRQFGAGFSEANQIKYVADFSGGSFGVQIVDDANGNYTPDILAMATFSAAGADFKVVGVYDDASSAWAAKAQAGYMGFGAIVQYSSAASKYAGSNQWVIGANYGFDATEKLNLNIGGSYGFSDSVFNPVNTWTVGAEAKYKLTDTFTVSARARVMEASQWDARVRFKAAF